MKYQIIDNFLSLDDFETLEKEFKCIFWQLNQYVADVNEKQEFKDSNWNWYLTHIIYDQNVPLSQHYSLVHNLFGSKFNDLDIFKTWIRIKVNLYPSTLEVNEHQPHTDYDYSQKSAVFSLNTCDGFTKMHDGTKIESIKNRLVLFDSSLPHNSSTTSNSKFRMNINFNWF